MKPFGFSPVQQRWNKAIASSAIVIPRCYHRPPDIGFPNAQVGAKPDGDGQKVAILSREVFASSIAAWGWSELAIAKLYQTYMCFLLGNIAFVLTRIISCFDLL